MMCVCYYAEVATPQSAGANLYSSHYASKFSTLTPSITPPLYSTTTAVRSATLGAQTSSNNRFQPSEGPPTESLYTLAQAAEADVQRELGQEQQVPAGVPLMEALATKGIGPRTSSLSSASGGDALTGHVSDSSLSPCHEPSARGDGTGNEYMPQRGGEYRPTPKPRSTSMIPLSERLSASDVSGSSSGNPHSAETLQNGYMKPRQAAGPASNYDQLPGGPPRPAPLPRQRSALLREDSSGTTATSSGPSGHTYINMQRSLDPQMRPPVNRSNKPQEPSPPLVNRQLKPDGSLSSTDDPESPPSCPVRISSLSASMSKSLDLGNSWNEQESAKATSSLSSIDDNTEGLVGFSETDLPKRSRSTMKYTQIQFHSAKGTPLLVEPSSQSPQNDELSKREPVPAPRPGVSRVNYSDVDLTATRALAEAGKVKTIQVNLAEAERQSLKEKPYINVNREGVVDDNSDPDYYTYMRVSSTCERELCVCMCVCVCVSLCVGSNAWV